MWPGGEDNDRLGIALSGGPDSLALTLLAQSAFPGRVLAATVDHGLREESAAEARHASGICASLGVPHAILPVEVAPGNLQAQARSARYETLEAHFAGNRVSVLATAHHADDQAETLLMRLNRGSGLSGLAGVRPCTVMSPAGVESEMSVIRPLLDWRRSELADIVASSGFTAIQDPYNADENFDRVRMRKAIAELSWLDPQALAASARHLAEAEEVVEAHVAGVMETLIREDGACLFPFGQPRLVEICVVENILTELGARDIRRSEVARLIDRLRAGQKASLGGVLASRALYTRDAKTRWDVMRFEPEPPRKSR